MGQCELMYTYDKLFGEYHHTTAQILLTRDVLEQPQRKQNAMNTFERLLALGAIPIVNENDTVSTEEIEFGDNDTLSAIVARLVKAGLLILLSDIDGLYDAPPSENPQARLIPHVSAITPAILAAAGGSGSRLGTGGMATKIQAAQMALDSGFTMVLASGASPELLYEPAGRRCVTRRRPCWCTKAPRPRFCRVWQSACLRCVCMAARVPWR